jgi:hypothetical protein
MLKYLTKFTVDIFPSVAATVIGAYIVNHYIVTKPEPPAAVSSVVPKAGVENKPAEKPAEASSLPQPGVKAKGMSERTLMERSASEKAAVVEKPHEKAERSTDSKPADAPSETASGPAEPRRHQSSPREKAVAKSTPSAVQPAAAPAVAATANPPSQPEAVVAPEERREANDLARVVIERLRGTGDGAQRPQEMARAPESHGVVVPSVRPLPPPITVSTPPSEAFGPKPPYATSAVDDPGAPKPPADIPMSRPPLDLRAEAVEPAKERTSIGEDVLSAAKSMFHAVLPKTD